MLAGRHSDSTPDSKRVRLCSRLPCAWHGAGSPTAVVCSRELVNCGNGVTLCCSSVDTRGHAVQFAHWTFPLVRLLRIVRFRRESVVFPGLILIPFAFSDLPRAPAPLCDHGLYISDKS